MSKKELVPVIAICADITEPEAKRCIDRCAEEISKANISGNGVRLGDFGEFCPDTPNKIMPTEDFIRLLGDHAGVDFQKASKFLDCYLDAMVGALKNGKSVNIRGVGTLSLITFKTQNIIETKIQFKTSRSLISKMGESRFKVSWFKGTKMKW